MKRVCNFLGALGVLWITTGIFAQGPVAVTGRINLTGGSRSGASVVAWLSPLSPQAGAASVGSVPPRARIVQKNKRFETRVLAVQVGSVVDFPNQDPFFHNVFSMFDGKRFDLGLYEAGATRSVRFDRPGVCYIFCNIHSQMSTTVVVVNSPYFVVSNAPGEFQIPRVPPGRYRFSVWVERCSPETLQAASREVIVDRDPVSLGIIQLKESRDLITGHSNKYGQDYESPIFSSPIYAGP